VMLFFFLFHVLVRGETAILDIDGHIAGLGLHGKCFLSTLGIVLKVQLLGVLNSLFDVLLLAILGLN
jgi:hypothetical protein